LSQIFSDLTDEGIESYLNMAQNDNLQIECYNYNEDQNGTILSSIEFIRLCNQIVDRLKISHGIERERISWIDLFANSPKSDWAIMKYDNGPNKANGECGISEISEISNKWENRSVNDYQFHECVFHLGSFNI